MTFCSTRRISAVSMLLIYPVMCLDVIGAGLPRTGTDSTKLALNALGFKTYHGLELFHNPEQQDFWRRVVKGEATIDDALKFVIHQHKYTATLDVPIMKFYKRQVDLFPEAKVLLTVRESGEAWAKLLWALHECMLLITDPVSITWPSLLTWYFGYKVKDLMNVVSAPGLLPESFLKPDADKHIFLQDAVSLYDSHVAEVKAFVPESRLLVFNVKDGWGPLCRFLGVQSPDGPYPRSNDTSKENLRLLSMGIKVFVYSWIPAVVALAYLFRKRMVLFGIFFVLPTVGPTLYSVSAYPALVITGLPLIELLVMMFLRCFCGQHAKED